MAAYAARVRSWRALAGVKWCRGGRSAPVGACARRFAHVASPVTGIQPSRSSRPPLLVRTCDRSGRHDGYVAGRPGRLCATKLPGVGSAPGHNWVMASADTLVDRLTEPWMLGRAARAEPRAAGAAGGDRQLVRAAAGQALWGGDGGVGDGLHARDPLRQREDVRGDAADRSARARGRSGVDPAVRRRPGDHARGGGTWPRASARMRSTSTWAARSRRCARRAPARRCWPTRSRGRARTRGG